MYGCTVVPYSISVQSLSKTIEMQSCVKAVMEFVKMDPLPHDQPTFELLARAAIGLNFAYCSQFIDKAVKYCIEWQVCVCVCACVCPYYLHTYVHPSGCMYIPVAACTSQWPHVHPSGHMYIPVATCTSQWPHVHWSTCVPSTRIM